MNIIPLHQPCGSDFTHNALGLHQFVVDRGWEAWLGGPRVASDIPTADETIEATGNFCLDRIGNWPPGQEPLVGYFPGGSKIHCTPRGLECLPLLEALLPGWVPAMRKRNERAVESILYVGSAPLSAFSPSTTVTKRNGILDGWLAPVLAAGFHTIGFDASAPMVVKPTKNPTLYLAERALTKGLKGLIESCEYPHPRVYPWYDGRFGSIVADAQDPAQSRWRTIHDWRGWYCPANTPACLTRFYVLLQGSVPVVDPVAGRGRTRMRLAEDAVSAGHTPVVDLGGVPEKWWKPVNPETDP